MRDRAVKRLGRRARIAAALGIPVLWSNRALPALELRLRGRTVANVAFAFGYRAVFGGSPNWLSASGFRWGLGSSALVFAGYIVALMIPALRRLPLEVAERVPETSTLEWIVLHIPVGTVLAEEAVFRGTLDPLLDEVAEPHHAAALGALDFGLCHVHPARATGESVPGTVALTTLAGLVFSALRRHTGSATAPALLHLAINAGGAMLPLAAEWIEVRSRG
ncbi:CPBP family intramembrane glutamic endopeptidase [Nocardia rhizosphaerae]|uniref:CPBP family intramembrane glutamic endopeptidase n=1 Tax=Nocardia rhizosphaerae TaxID=1691571 RepID=A0ABV8L162_9NOCA